VQDGGVDDTFARFVAVLAQHLDDHAARSGDLAARVFVSRSQLDRIVGAVAGETPARFRRRVLLERAAYRLRTSDITILDAAVDAGYASHEAFTRAFRSVYGLAPAVWRTSRAPIHVPAPNGVHFYPPGGLRLPARDKVASMTFVSGLVDHHVNVIGQMLDRAATLTDDQLDAPLPAPPNGIDDDPTIRSVLSRLVGQMQMWNAAMANEPYDFGVERHESLDSMRGRLQLAGTAFARYVREVAEQDRFDETFVDAMCDEPFLFTAAGMIGHVLTYAAYRRTMVVAALEQAGAGDVDDEPLHWFAPGETRGETPGERSR
jgi:AraC family transcriptional regulator